MFNYNKSIMIKVWGKTIKNEKIAKSIVVSVQPSQCTFFEMIKQVCEGLDIPTPVILKKHVQDFNKFSMTLFKATDFVENIHFDRLIIQYLPE